MMKRPESPRTLAVLEEAMKVVRRGEPGDPYCQQERACRWAAIHHEPNGSASPAVLDDPPSYMEEGGCRLDLWERSPCLTHVWYDPRLTLEEQRAAAELLRQYGTLRLRERLVKIPQVQRGDLREGVLYEVHSRNLHVAVFTGDRAFTGPRWKFDEYRLATEYLAVETDGESATGTVHFVAREICPVPEEWATWSDDQQLAWMVDHAKLLVGLT